MSIRRRRNAPLGPLVTAALWTLLPISCGSVQIHPGEHRLQPFESRHVEGLRPAPPETNRCTWLEYLADQNRRILERDYADERSFYHSGETRPDLAISLSGGGMRAAAFAIGVLSGLAKKESAKIEDLDIMSSVSGGGYALSWYYLQQFYLDRYRCASRACGDSVQCQPGSLCPGCPAGLTERDGPFQKRLRRHGGLMGVVRGLFHGALDLVTSPANLFLNGLFGTHSNTAWSRTVYENRIAQVFHTVPAEACGGYTNGYLSCVDRISNWFDIGIHDGQISFPQLGTFANRQGLPLFIINTTAYIDDDLNHLAGRLSNSVFEFTPKHIGSSAFGYYKWPDVKEPISVARAVSISGAALDGAIIAGSTQKTLWSLFNLDSGFYLDNPSKHPSAEQKALHNFLPFPFYLGHYYLKDYNGVRIYLTDGGHSDNLGVFSVVRRLPKRLIIVDGEQDYNPHLGTFKFESYYRIKVALKDEMGVDFTVPQIEKELRNQGPYTAGFQVMKGRIHGFPYRESKGGPVDIVDIDVRYLKLSISQDDLDQYPEAVRNYYESTRNESCEGLLSRCAFPQESTTDLSYSEEQFDAYRELGAWMAKSPYLALGPGEETSESGSCQCAW